MHAHHPSVRGVMTADLMQPERGQNKGKGEKRANQANHGNGPVMVHSFGALGGKIIDALDYSSEQLLYNVKRRCLEGCPETKNLYTKIPILGSNAATGHKLSHNQYQTNRTHWGPTLQPNKS